VRSTVPLFAWANPVFGGLADHTWVTNYAAPFSCDHRGPRKHFWYCWGDCHPAGPGTTARALGSAPGDLILAQCIAAPNSTGKTSGNPALGGIDHYMFDGVCHQVANRVLYATTGDNTRPLTVELADGYADSVFAYGEYGGTDEEWEARRRRCHAPASARGSGDGGSFFSLVRRRLAGLFRAELIDRLRPIHEAMQKDRHRLGAEVRGRRIGGEKSAAMMNAVLKEHVREVAKVLSASEFEAVFHRFPQDTVGVVDPQIAASAYPARPKPARSRRPATTAAGAYLAKDSSLGMMLRKASKRKVSGKRIAVALKKSSKKPRVTARPSAASARRKHPRPRQPSKKR
jgi:hypothetical protein